MSLIKEAAVLNAKGADSGQSVPGAFPLETSGGVASNTTQRIETRQQNVQGKSVAFGPKGAPLSKDGRKLDGNYSWLKSLDVLEAQPVKDIKPLQSDQTRHMKLSRSQLENMDTFDVMDAMERGEW